jgi:hypothetical protein
MVASTPMESHMTHRSILALAGIAATLGISTLAPTEASAQYRPYGPDQCRDGFVWREAFPGDHVCVRPHIRSEAAADNAAAPNRIYGNGYCVNGYVWRESYPGDHVCVPPEVRARAARDNDRAVGRIAD